MLFLMVTAQFAADLNTEPLVTEASARTTSLPLLCVSLLEGEERKRGRE